MKYKKYLLFGIVVLALFLRFYHWEEKFTFNAEYNYKLWPIKQIVIDHKLPLIGIEAVSYLHHIHYPPFFLYFSAPLLFFSNLNPASIEIALILLSAVTTYIFYLLGKEIRNEKFGYILSFLYAISFLAQRSDRFIWVVGPVLGITALFLLFLARALKKENCTFKDGLLLGITIGVGINFHYQIVALIVALLFFLINGQFRKKLTRSSLVAFFLGIFFFVAPLIIFDLRHNFYNLEGARLLLSYSSDSLSFERRIVSTLAATASFFLGIFIPQSNPASWVTDTVWITVPTVGLLYYLLYARIKKKGEKCYTKIDVFSIY